MRKQIRSEIESISPLDEMEAKTQRDVLAWIDSGAELCRLEKPATPNKHLVSYFAVVDGEYLLLVDHINAQLWLPTGGHVEPGEHPRSAAVREAAEELALRAEFLFEKPLLLTSTVTGGKSAGHTDVSIWYALKGDRTMDISYDTTEFQAIRWFHKESIPLDRADPQMARFITKLYHIAA